MSKPIRCMISAEVTGQALQGTWLRQVLDGGYKLHVVRLDAPIRLSKDGVTDYLVVYDRQVSFEGHH